MKKEMWVAVWTLISIIIGAGVIGLPYVIQKAGFLTGLLVIILVVLIMTLINFYLAEIVLRTKNKHQIPGLGGIYLGKFGKYFISIFYVLGIYGALTAYIIAAGQVLSAIFNFGNYFYFSLGFLIVLSAIIFFNLNIFQRAESILNPLKLIIITLLIIFLFPYVNFSNLLEFNFKNLLIPYGVIIFAFTGFSAIPEMAYELKNKINLRKAIIYAMLITFVIYSLFCLVMIGISGKDITQVATLSLENLGNFSLFGNLFSLLALSTAFIGLGFSLKNSLILDYKLKNLFSWIFVIGIPAILFFLNLGNFILFLELSGAISIGVILISILIMHSKAKSIGKRKPEFQFKDNLFVKVLLFILVIIGIIYTLSGLV